MSGTIPKPFVFVLMPFQEEFDDVYNLGIKSACDNAGAYAERVDEQMFQDSIIQRVYNQIAKADIIVADMTGRNPNVFYEVGYAHALGKHVVLLTQNADDIPFDLKHYPHIIYNGRIVELIPELEKRVRWFIDNPEEPSDSEQPPVEFCINGIPLSKTPTLEIENVGSRNIRDVEFSIDAHNQDNARILVVSFKVAVFSTKRFSESSDCEGTYKWGIQLPEEGVAHMRDDVFTILPGAWESFRVGLSTDVNHLLRLGDEEQLALRMFTEHGGYDYPFKIKIVAAKK